jgi:hypothetical protein
MLVTAQTFIKTHAKFLTTEGGRGIFYLFQGSIMMVLEKFSIELSLFLAIYMFFLGTLLIAMQYGFDPAPWFGRRKNIEPELVTQPGRSYIRLEGQ